MKVLSCTRRRCANRKDRAAHTDMGFANVLPGAPSAPNATSAITRHRERVIVGAASRKRTCSLGRRAHGTLLQRPDRKFANDAFRAASSGPGRS